MTLRLVANDDKFPTPAPPQDEIEVIQDKMETEDSTSGKKKLSVEPDYIYVDGDNLQTLAKKDKRID